MMLVLIITVSVIITTLLFLGKVYESPEKQYNNLLGATDLAANECAATVLNNEKNYTWLRVMQAAFHLDQRYAWQHKILAAKAYERGDLTMALNHLRKVKSWYNAYNSRLKRIYGVEPGEVPPMPVIR